MRIQHNIMAMNSYRSLGINNNNLSKSLEKLSSGYKINRAGDDAAGLAISEKMRAQITGLEASINNVKDGISLVKTAEGSLQEIHDMLNRMVYLSEQSANGTYEDEVDRNNLQLELNSLRDEVDRIAESANFNGIKLLNGDLASSGAPKVEGLTTKTVDATAGVFTTGDLSSNLTANSSVLTIEYKDADGKSAQRTINFTATADAANAQVIDAINNDTVLSKLFKAEKAADTKAVKITSLINGANPSISKVNLKNDSADVATANIASTTSGQDAYEGYEFVDADVGKEFTVNGKKFVFVNNDKLSSLDADVNGVVVETDDTIEAGDVEKMAAMIEQKTGYKPAYAEKQLQFRPNTDKNYSGLELQIGDTSDTYNRLNVAVDAMDSKAIGISDVDISTQGTAQNAIDKIKNAINTVSITRGNLGAIQNRLEHTQNNLAGTRENIQDAESTVRDVDVPEEMMEFTKNNILIQSAQAMLAQANQVPQGVLSLLQ